MSRGEAAGRPRRRRWRLHRRPSGRRPAPPGAAACARWTSSRMSEWYQVHPDAENVVADLSLLENAMAQTEGAREVYMLAADMGGMGFIENNKALCMLTVLTSTHMLQAAQRRTSVERYFYSSSACVYAADKQTDTDITALQRGRRLPGDARGRLRLGEAVHRADVPALPRGLRPAPPGWRATTTSTARTAPGPAAARRRPAAVCRKIAEAVDHRRRTRSRSGATASRPAASCTSTTACRARR